MRKLSDTSYGVIFDMDGVLADTAHAHYESWQAVARRYGVTITWEAFHNAFGRPNREIIPILLGRRVSEDELRFIDSFKEARYRETLFRDGLKPIPGAVELVRELHCQGFRLAIGSSGPRKNVEAVLSTLGVEGCFDAIVAAEDVPHGKPAPDVFLQAACRLGVPAYRCLVIEDAPSGIAAARAAGMKCVALTTTRPERDLRGADLILPSLQGFGARDVLGLLKGS